MSLISSKSTRWCETIANLLADVPAACVLYMYVHTYKAQDAFYIYIYIATRISSAARFPRDSD